jgi:hypothetical protein
MSKAAQPRPSKHYANWQQGSDARSASDSRATKTHLTPRDEERDFKKGYGALGNGRVQALIVSLSKQWPVTQLCGLLELPASTD